MQSLPILRGANLRKLGGHRAILEPEQDVSYLRRVLLVRLHCSLPLRLLLPFPHLLLGVARRRRLLGWLRFRLWRFSGGLDAVEELPGFFPAVSR